MLHLKSKIMMEFIDYKIIHLYYVWYGRFREFCTSLMKSMRYLVSQIQSYCKVKNLRILNIDKTLLLASSNGIIFQAVLGVNLES